MAKALVEGKLTPHALTGLLKKLEGNRNAAYLLVSDGLSEKCLYFSVGAIRLTSWGRRRVRLLDDMLAVHPKVEAPTLERARKRGEDVGETLEDALGNMDYGEVVRDCSTALVRDELLDLIVWDGAVYEYCESNPPPKIFDPRLQAVKLSFGVGKVLKEAEEGIQLFTRAQARFGTGKSRLVRGSAFAYSAPEEVDPRIAQAILAGVGEQGASVDEIFLACRKIGIDVLAATAALETLVEKRVLEQSKSQSSRISKEDELADARREATEIEAALEFLINELAARQRLAGKYELMGEEKKAVHNLKRVGEELATRNRNDEAIGTFRQVLKLAPNDFGTRERIMHIYERLKRIPEAFAEGRDLAQRFKKFGLMNRAKLVFRHLLRLDPGQVETRRELIDLLIKLRENQEAVGEYEELADLMRERQEDDQVLAIYQQILKLDPNHQKARASLRSVERRQWAFVVPYAAVAAGFLILFGVSAYVISEYRIVSDFTKARKIAFDKALAADFAGAREAVEDFVARHEGRRDRVSALREEIVAIEKEHRQRVAAEEYARARALEAGKRGMDARATYQALIATGKGTEWEAKAQDRIRAIDIDIDEGERIGNAVRRLFQEKKDREAYDKARELIHRFSWTPAASVCRVPLAIETVPPGAAVSIDQKEPAVATPCVRAFSAVMPFTLTLTLPGFAPESRLIDLREDVPYPYHVDMKKSLKWKAAALGPLEEPPTVGADGVFLGARDQRAYALWPDGRPRWSRALGIFSDVLGRTMRAGSLVVVADRSGQVTALDAESGAVKWRVRLAEPAGGIAAPSKDVVVLAESSALIGLKTANGEERWRVKLPGPLAAPAVATESDALVLAATIDGSLVAVEATTGHEIGRFAIGARPVAPPAVATSGYLVATEDGLLRLLATKDGHETWHKRLPAVATAAPLATAATVFVPVGDRLMALDLRDGAERWSYELRAPIRATPAATRAGRLYVGASDGTLYALASETGALRWSFHTSGEILAQPLANADTVYVASRDFTLYAIAD